MSTGAGDYDSTVAIIPVRVKLINRDKYIETYASLDEGSDATFCTTKLMDQLNARGRITKVRLRTMEKTGVIDTHVIRGLEVCDLSGTNTVKLPMVYTREEMPVSMEDVPRQADVDRWSYLRGIHIPDIDSEVELLIGTNAPKANERTVDDKPEHSREYRMFMSMVSGNVEQKSTCQTIDHKRNIAQHN